MDEQMVERVARALWEADGLGVNGNAWRWETIDAATKEPSLKRARAAIAAHKAAWQDAGYVLVPREPTTEMLDALSTDPNLRPSYEDLWRQVVEVGSS
jgi:hypothetical protein